MSKSFQIVAIVISNCSISVQNVIHVTLKWLFFFQKITIGWERDHVFSVRPFPRHLFRCRTFSAQIVSAPIRCFLTVQLFGVRVRLWVGVIQKAADIGAEKVRAEMVAHKSRGLAGDSRCKM